MPGGSSVPLGLRRNSARNRQRPVEKNSLVPGSMAAIIPLPIEARTTRALLFSPPSRQASWGRPIFLSNARRDTIFAGCGRKSGHAKSRFIAACRAVPDRTPDRPVRRPRGGQPASRRRLTPVRPRAARRHPAPGLLKRPPIQGPPEVRPRSAQYRYPVCKSLKFKIYAVPALRNSRGEAFACRDCRVRRMRSSPGERAGSAGRSRLRS